MSNFYRLLVTSDISTSLALFCKGIQKKVCGDVKLYKGGLAVHTFRGLFCATPVMLTGIAYLSIRWGIN